MSCLNVIALKIILELWSVVEGPGLTIFPLSVNCLKLGLCEHSGIWCSRYSAACSSIFDVNIWYRQFNSFHLDTHLSCSIDSPTTYLPCFNIADHIHPYWSTARSSNL